MAIILLSGLKAIAPMSPLCADRIFCFTPSKLQSVTVSPLAVAIIWFLGLKATAETSLKLFSQGLFSGVPSGFQSLTVPSLPTVAII